MTSKIMLAGAALVALAATAAGYRFGVGHWFARMPATAVLAPSHPRGAQSATAESSGRKVLYYRNPMGLPDTSPVPKKDWMGMDYMPVYEGEDQDDGSTVKVSLDRVQRSGVRTEAAQMRVLSRPIKAPGIALPDERTLKSVTLRFDGYIERLYANTTGQQVTKGEPLFAVFSPELVSAQIDYQRATATTAARSREQAEQYAKVVLQRFRNLGLPDGVIEGLAATGALPQRIEWPSPASGTVLEKKVVEGQMVKAGEEIYRLADLGSIWVIADVAEQDIASIGVGSPARVRFRALPGELFEGEVSFVLHELDAATRTGKARVEIKNPEHRIKHEMYAEVEIDAVGGDRQRLVVPASAVLDSGSRQVVIVERGEGLFEPRSVTLGLRGEDLIEVRAGLEAGENVVVSANFLIDAESNLKAALRQFTAGSRP